MAEEAFDRIFLQIYEEEFIDCIFANSEALITREEFVISIAGNLNEKPRCEWIF